jgi:hypothetical protein
VVHLLTIEYFEFETMKFWLVVAIVALSLHSVSSSSFVDRILSPLRRSEDGHGNVYVTSADDVAEYHALLYTKEFSSDNFSDPLALLRATRRPLIFTGLNSNDYEKLTEFLPLMGFVGEDPALLLVHFLTDPTNNTHYYSFLISNKDARLFENDTETEQFANDVRIHLDSFIIYCGGLDVEGCWDYIKLYSAGEERTEEMLYFQNHDTHAVEATMEPPGNAVWRLFLQTTYSYFKADSGTNYDFDGQQVSTFTTHSCYVYLQAEPESYLVFYNVKASHKTEPLVQNYDTVGYYFSNYQPGMSGTLSSTGNSLKMLHATPRSLNNTEPFNPKVIVNRYSREIDMAYGAVVTKDGLVIKDADAFTVSFVDERMITQWSVERHFNLNNYQGFWKYHQQFPVDTLQNDIEAHTDRWEEYFQVSGDACLVRDVSEHSALMIETSNSIGWIVDVEHRSKDGQTLLVDVSVGSKITMYATTCQGHKIIPVVSELQRTWRINIADLNNISKE